MVLDLITSRGNSKNRWRLEKNLQRMTDSQVYWDLLRNTTWVVGDLTNGLVIPTNLCIGQNWNEIIFSEIL